MIIKTIDSHSTYSGLSPEQISDIKQELTFENPAYKNALRYSKWGRVSLPQTLKYYKSLERGVIEVPLGYKPKFKVDKVVNNSNKVPCDYPKFCMTLRATQQEAFKSYVLKGATFGKQCIQLPTGKGKTVLGIYIASKLKQKTLIVVHKVDLIDSWESDIKTAFEGRVAPSIFRGTKRAIGEQFTIATIQTLSKLPPEEFNDFKQNFGFVIQDEMHHCPASTFSLVNEIPSRYRLGLSATPERNDGLTHIMNLYFGDFCYTYTATKDDEDILPVDVLFKDVPVYCDPVCTGKNKVSVIDFGAPKNYVLKENEYRLSSVSYAKRQSMDLTGLTFQTYDNFVLSHKDYLSSVCNSIYSEYSNGYSCVAFFLLKEEIALYYSYLTQDLEVPEDDIVVVSGDYSNKQNSASLERARKERKLITLTTYAKSNEGTNVNQWEVAFLVSSLNNGRGVEQVAGRIRRSYSNKLQRVRLYDFAPTEVKGSLMTHRMTRITRYKKLGFNLTNEQSTKTIHRGWRSI